MKKLRWTLLAILISSFIVAISVSGMIMSASFSSVDSNVVGVEQARRSFWFWSLSAFVSFGFGVFFLWNLWTRLPWRKVNAHANLSKEEALAILDEQEKIAKLISYAQLVNFLNEQQVEVFDVFGKDGLVYEVEREVFWDDQEIRTVRVFLSINLKGDLSVYRPLSKCFIMSPNGEFVDE